MNILIVKMGALGDVVRTSYFARALKEKFNNQVSITWLTASSAVPLLKNNPWIDRIVTSFAECQNEHYDHVYSLDDEIETLRGVGSLNAAAITGAYLRDDRRTYTADAAVWFDMGLLSRFGKEHADRLKKENRRGHAEIFCEIFGVKQVAPEFYGDSREEAYASKWLGREFFNIAINPFAGKRWPSKGLREQELKKLIAALLNHETPGNKPPRMVLLGSGVERERNLEIAAQFDQSRVWVADTEASVLCLAAVIARVNVIITSDSLVLHLAIAQGIPFVAFFAPTSAAEIDDFDLGVKVTSTAADYCSYKPDADNSTLTAESLMEAYKTLIGRLRVPLEPIRQSTVIGCSPQ